MKRLILCLIAVLFLFSLTYAGEITKITVDFKDADLRPVLKLISDIAKRDGVDIYIDPDIKGKITVKIENTPWDYILREIAEKFHLLAATKRNLLFIYLPSNHEKLKKQFDFDVDMVSRSKKSSQSNLPSDGRPIKLTLKNGNTMTWSNYTENGDQYCTQKSIGLFCIQKNSVASIVAKEEEYPDAVVIVNKTSDTEKEASRNDFLDNRKTQEKKQENERKKQECKEMRNETRSFNVKKAVDAGNPYKLLAAFIALRDKYELECLTETQRAEVRAERATDAINYNLKKATDAAEKAAAAAEKAAQASKAGRQKMEDLDWSIRNKLEY